MNDKKICFIMCVNDKLYEEECIRYIQKLNVPEGYEVEQLSIWDAPSMAAGYNEGMRQSDAKYKVYLHQDVFVVYQNFIYEFLKNIFSGFEDRDGRNGWFTGTSDGRGHVGRCKNWCPVYK